MNEHNPHLIQKFCYHIIFSGRVQGVGFRFTAQRFAVDAGLTGWVKNLSDGRVEVRVEGDAPGIDAFLARLQTHFSIDEMKKNAHSFTGTCTSFEIRY